jgi:plasmid stability protein
MPAENENHLVREILRTALSTGRSRHGSLADAIRARIEPLGGVELEIAPREAVREPTAEWELLRSLASTEQ